MARRYWPLALIVAQRLWAFHAFPLSAEDAYISFHSAVDPAWMKATTSPLYAFILSWGEPQSIARSLALLGDVIACAAVLKRAEPAGGLLFCLFWCTPFMTGSATSGLETHLGACALVAGMVWPLAYAFACWRPDAIVMALALGGKHWPRTVVTAIAFVVAAWILAATPLPQTLGSKLATYGVHWFKGWYWWHSEGLEWLEIPLIVGAGWAAWRSRIWRYFGVALAPLLLHWTLGTPNFWWYAVPSAAMLAALYCSQAGRKGMMLGLAAILLCWPAQWWRLTERARQEETMWDAGEELARMAPSGTLFLEPAGIIPWLNRNLRVVDEVGLVEPWVGKRRREGDGWMADALERYRPEWIVVRTRFLRYPLVPFTGASKPFRNHGEVEAVMNADSTGYWIKALPTRDGLRVRYQACDMAIMARKNTQPPPDSTGPVTHFTFTR